MTYLELLFRSCVEHIYIAHARYVAHVFSKNNDDYHDDDGVDFDDDVARWIITFSFTEIAQSLPVAESWFNFLVLYQDGG